MHRETLHLVAVRGIRLRAVRRLDRHAVAGGLLRRGARTKRRRRHNGNGARTTMKVSVPFVAVGSLQVAVVDQAQIVLSLEPRPQLGVDQRIDFLGAIGRKRAAL